MCPPRLRWSRRRRLGCRLCSIQLRRHAQGARRFGSYGFDRIQPIVDKLGEVGASHGGKTPSQVALNWCICKGAVPIPGAKSAAQARAGGGCPLAAGPPGCGCLNVPALLCHVCCARAPHPPSPCVLAWQAEANCGALGWRLTADEVEQLDALAIEGQLKFGQHG